MSGAVQVYVPVQTAYGRSVAQYCYKEWSFHKRSSDHINLTNEDLILKPGQVVANLSPVELYSKTSSNTKLLFQSKTGEAMEPHAFTQFPTLIDGSKRNDNS